MSTEDLKRRNKRGAEGETKEYSQPFKKRGIDVDESNTITPQTKEEDEEPFLPKTDELNMLRYQKRCMGVKLQEQKYLIVEMSSKLETLGKKMDSQSNLLNSVNRIWDQLLRDCFSSLNKLNSSSSTAMNLNFSPPKFLELYSLGEGTTVESSLQSRCNETKAIVNKLVDELLKQKSQTDKIFQSVLENSQAVQPTILNEIEKTLQTNKQLVLHNQELETKNKEQFSKVEHLEGTILQLKEKLKESENDIYSMKEKLELEQKRKFRIEAKYSELLDQMKNQKFEVNSSLSTSESGSAPVKLESPGAIQSLDANTIKDLEETKYLAQSRLRLIEKLQDDKLALVNETQKWQREATYISEERITKSRIYLDMYQKLSAEIEDFRNRFNSLEREIKQKETQVHQQKEKITVLNSENESLFKKLKESEQKAIRYRSARNQLQQSLEMKQTAPQQSTLKEYQQLLYNKDVEIKKAKEMCYRVQEELNKSKNVKEETRKEQDKLFGELAIKNEELSEMKTKFDELAKRCQELEEKEREFQAISEIFNAQAKDKRELKDVRVSEQKLRDENESLKSKISELEKITNIKEIQEKHQQDLVSLKNEFIMKNAKNEKLIISLKSELENQKIDEERMLSEIELVGTSYEESQEQNKRLLQQISEHQDVITQLTAEQMKNAQLGNKYKEERDILIEKLNKMEQKSIVQNEVFEKSEARAKLLTEQLKKLGDELKMQQGLAESLKKSLRENSHLRPRVEVLEKEFSELLAKHEDISQKYEKEKFRAEKLQEEAESQKRKYDKEIKGVSSDVLSEERIKSLEHKLNCGVCNDQPKSVIITRCYHMFCKGCVQKNLSVRSRKCPACGKPFGESDVHPIYF